VADTQRQFMAKCRMLDANRFDWLLVNIYSVFLSNPSNKRHHEDHYNRSTEIVPVRL